MFYDISFLGLWLALAFLLGAGVGWRTEVSGAQAPWFFGWFRNALVAWIVGLVAAWLHWLPGRLGFWLESALLFFAFYILGCLIGGRLRSAFSPPAVATAGLAPAGGSPFPSREGGAPVAGRASPTPAAATPPAATAVAPRTSAVVSETVLPPVASAVASDAVVAPPASAIASDAVAPPLASAVAADTAPVPQTALAANESQPAATVDVAGVRGASVEEPAAMGPLEGEDKHEGQRPQGLVAPRGGIPDDLKHIRGVGIQNEGRLHALGIWHFQQIADWTPENVRWIGSYLAFPGRIDREGWISQAKVLAAGQETEFSRRAERGEIATSRDDGTEGQQNIAELSKIKPHE